MKRIILIGFRGSGKSTIGEMVADKLGFSFYDTDAVVETLEGKTIPQIFSLDGEAAFREAESKAVRALPPDSCVVATGGGVVLNTENVKHLRRNSVVFLLNVTPATAATRISGSGRPTLTGKTIEDEAAELISQRMPSYRSAADYCIDAEEDLKLVCDRIIEVMKKVSCPEDSMEEVTGYFSSSPMPEEIRKETLRRVGLAGSVPFCAIAGNPCLHSKSPAVYSALFEFYGIDSHYTYMQADSIQTVTWIVRRAGMKGLSVTIPFKEDVIECLDEIDAHSEKIGAVNTVLNSCGRLYGMNTDWIGIREPLRDSEGSNAVVFGAGGAARAAVYALMDLGKEVTVINRTPERGLALADHFDCMFAPPGDFKSEETDIVVNATSLGMGGKGSPLSEGQLRSGMTVFDLVYTPPVTPLLAMADRAGCSCIPGTEMFVFQAAEQFRHLFGIIPDTEIIREALEG